MNLKTLNIGLIGGGNMGYAIVAGLLRAGHGPQFIRVGEPAAERQAPLRALSPELAISGDNRAVSAGSDVVVVAVKPQIMKAVVTELGVESLAASTLVMSVAAGVTLASLGDWLPSAQPIVRVMPNQPALIGAGISVLAAGGTVTGLNRMQADYVAGSTGSTAWIDDESLMDAVTAVSGSGPAYFYLLMETMQAVARQLGLPQSLAGTLVNQTALGAARLASQADADLQALRSGVTSPGGTTEAAIAVLEKAGLRDIVSKALTAGRDRSVELGRLARK